MAIDKLTVWASDGTEGQLEEPPAGKVALGWNADEQPPAEWENFRRNEVDTKTNEIITEETLSSEYDITDDLYTRCSELQLATLLYPQNGINTHTLSSDTYRLVAICRGYNFVNSRECIFGLHAAGADKISVIWSGKNLDTGDDYLHTMKKTVVTLDDGPISESAVPVGLCCDGHYIYIIANLDSDAGSKIYKYALSDTDIISSTLEASLVVGSTNIFELNQDYGSDGGVQICVADVNNLAFIDSEDNRIGIVAKTLTTAPAYGTGLVGSIGGETGFASATILSCSIVSDGIRVWTWYKVVLDGAPSGRDFLVPALISDPTDDTGGITPITTYPCLIERPYAEGRSIAFDGNAIHAISIYDNGSGTQSIYDSIYDLSSNVWSWARYKIEDGFGSSWDIGLGLSARACFTGRRVAVACPVCPVEDLSTSGLSDKCNEHQIGLTMLDTNRGGYDAGYGSLEQVITLDSSRVTALQICTPSAISAGLITQTRNIVFADNTIWVLLYTYNVLASPAYSSVLIRILAADRR